MKKWIFGCLFFAIFMIHDIRAEAQEFFPKKDKYVIVIDPGHGTTDPGTSSEYFVPSVEKDINLMIALKLRDMLESMGIKTVMTRTDDSAIYDSSASSIREKKVSDIRNRLKIINETEN